VARPVVAFEGRNDFWLVIHTLAAGRASDRTRCRTCKLTESLQHPDLHWLFPRPRLKGSSDPDLADIREDMAEGIAERLANGGLYESPGGDEGIFIATIRSIVQTAVLKPAWPAEVFIMATRAHGVAGRF
jgi:DNA polymerase-3 subunit delta'